MIKKIITKIQVKICRKFFRYTYKKAYKDIHPDFEEKFKRHEKKRKKWVLNNVIKCKDGYFRPIYNKYSCAGFKLMKLEFEDKELKKEEFKKFVNIPYYLTKDDIIINDLSEFNSDEIDIHILKRIMDKDAFEIR